MSEPDPTRTPGVVIAAAAAGTVVVPFLIVYSFLFIVRGGFVEVDQPDITSSRTGELVAGLIAFGFLLFVLWGIGRLLNGWDRWVFLAGQLLTFGLALRLLLDSASGDPQVPAVVLAASLLAIALTCLRTSWQWVASEGGHRAADQPGAAGRSAAAGQSTATGRSAAVGQPTATGQSTAADQLAEGGPVLGGQSSGATG